MQINYGYIRAENRDAYESLMNLKDSDGHFALTSAHRKIIEYIGSMPGENGCFATDHTLNDQSIRAKTHKTLRRHIQYLISIGAIRKTVANRKRVLKLNKISGPVLSQKEFRVSKGMSEYAYATKQEAKNTEPKMEEKLDTSWFFEDEKQPVFFEKQEAKLAEKKDILAPKTANFAPVLYTKEDNYSKTNLPLKSPPRSQNNLNKDGSENLGCEDAMRASPASDGGEGRRLSEASPRVTDPKSLDLIEKEKKHIEWDEPLLEKKRKKRAKNQRESMAQAMQDNSNGHIVNPLGIKDNRPKKLNPKLARDISETGSVTVPQLYRHLIKTYDAAFGSGIIVGMLPDDKSAIATYFSNAKQKFIEACKYEPSNRDIADYFSWFLEPSRVAQLLKSAKYGNDKALVHFNQMLGLAYIRKFYDEVLKKRKPQDPLQVDTDVSPAIAKIREKSAYLDEAFGEFESTQNDIVDFVNVAIVYGFGLQAQFLAEKHGFSADECRTRIISQLAEYINLVGDKPYAIESFHRVKKLTIRNKKILDQYCVWWDLEKYLDGMVEEAISKAGATQ